MRDELNSLIKAFKKDSNDDIKEKIKIIFEEKLGGVSLESEIEFPKIPNNQLEKMFDHILYVVNNKFVPKNEYDREFEALINKFKETSTDDMVFQMIKILEETKKVSHRVYVQFVQYFSNFHFWGTLDPELGDYSVLRKRAEVLKHHIYDFIWLYNLTNDYLSKRTLIAILSNWYNLNVVYLQQIKSIFRDYWEPDLFPTNEGDVLVDLGAFNGDSIKSYVEMYGTNYNKIYAYEITPDTCMELKNNIRKMGLHDVIVKQKGAGSENGTMYINDNESTSSANSLNSKGKISVDVVKLDDDLEDIPTFIKMDIEGAEKSAILGLEKTIREQSPKLAICIYHGYDDIWEIPNLIYSINPNYDFYIRHNGGNLIPTEFVLLCKPKNK